ncbi:MAG TPA: tRNA (adenosine(37)-N6)-threonylcarbamoyltransferase complex dimerization subunit type 1 TsaB, partial [Deinococcales bacterium]|nr:tRNA (adenosine(37)-N6)-threonylcarbamoyltransferase complex dimerization subunit type 1 TsaB [Deinococcales bacterium]
PLQTVLAIETATPYLVLGLLQVADDGSEAIALEHVERVERAHAELAVPRVQELLQRAGSPVPTLLVVGAGPGSFTGVRVGASLALGMARGWGATVVGVPTLEAIAATVSDGVVAAGLDARKGNLYGAAYRVRGGLIEETLLAVDKRPREEFLSTLPPGCAVLEDAPPGGLALGRLGLRQGRPAPLDLVYL